MRFVHQDFDSKGVPLTLARERWRREVQGDSSGRNSKGLLNSCRERSRASARRSMTGVARRFPSKDTSRSCAQCRISTAHTANALLQGTITKAQIEAPAYMQNLVHASLPCQR